MVEPGHRVSLDAIERELAAMWKASNREQQDGHATTVRASVLNLMVVVQGEAALEQAIATIEDLGERHPSRTLLLMVRDEEAAAGAPPVEAWLSAHCQLPRDGTVRVCREQIVLAARRDATDHLPSLAAQLLIGDLPVLLWWPGEPPLGSGLLTNLVELSDALVLDSAQFSQPLAGLAKLAAHDLNPHFDIALGDFNWSRLTPWRELTAQCFDSASTLPLLAQVDEVIATYADSNPAQALLYIGWLASRLGWRPVGAQATGDSMQMVASRPNGRVSLFLHTAVPGGVAPGELLAVEVRAQAACFTIRRSDDRTAAETCARLPDGMTVARVARLEQASLSRLLAEQLDLLGKDPVYEAALHAAVALMAPLEIA